MTKLTRAIKPSILEALNEGDKEQISAAMLEVSPAEKAPNSDASSMTFGQALICIKRGDRVARAGWKDKSEYVQMRNPSGYVMICSEGAYLYPWAPTQRDMLAEDWRVVG